LVLRHSILPPTNVLTVTPVALAVPCLAAAVLRLAGVLLAAGHTFGLTQ
jgi:hypothetical protein